MQDVCYVLGKQTSDHAVRVRTREKDAPERVMGNSMIIAPKTIDTLMARLERSQELQGIRTRQSASKQLAESVAMWSAWKQSMIEIMRTSYKLINTLRSHRVLNQDVSSALGHLRDLLNKTQNHAQTWATHVAEIGRAKAVCEQEARGLRATRQELSQELQRALDTLTQFGEPSSVHKGRMLLNFASVLESTQSERRELLRNRMQTDTQEHTKIFGSLISMLHYTDRSHQSQLEEMDEQIADMVGQVNRATARKIDQNQAFCRALQDDWTRRVLEPVLQLLPEAKRHFISNTIAHDPYCLRRSEMVLLELTDAQRALQEASDAARAPAMDPDAVYDDDILKQARTDRLHMRRRIDAEQKARLEQFRAAIGRKQQQMVHTREKIAQFRAAIDQMQQSVHAPSESDAIENRRTAALVRLGEQKQADIAAQLNRAELELADLERDIDACLRGRSTQDRRDELEVQIGLIGRVYGSLARQHRVFQAALGAEEAVKTMIRAYMADESRTICAESQEIVDQLVESSVLELRRVDLALNQLDDRIAEAGRRLHTMETARLRQELQVKTVHEIGMLTALESYLIANNESSMLADQLVKIDGAMAICQMAAGFAKDQSARLQTQLTFYQSSE